MTNPDEVMATKLWDVLRKSHHQFSNARAIGMLLGQFLARVSIAGDPLSPSATIGALGDILTVAAITMQSVEEQRDD